MSFLSRISPEGYEELFRLFAAGHYLIGPTPKEILESQKQLQHRLKSIWDAVDPKPPGMNFSDFRHSASSCSLTAFEKKTFAFAGPCFNRHRKLFNCTPQNHENHRSPALA